MGGGRGLGGTTCMALAGGPTILFSLYIGGDGLQKYFMLVFNYWLLQEFFFFLYIYSINNNDMILLETLLAILIPVENNDTPKL